MNMEILFAEGIGKPDLLTASDFLDTLSKHKIANVPWKEFSYRPDVSFAISYTDESILLKYYVSETSFKAIYNNSNEPVYRDSCVEFFVAFDDEGYYNLEFNAIGTCLASYGKERSERKSLPAETIDRIKYHSSIRSENSDEKLVSWELTLVIPFDIFKFHTVTTLKNKECRANFYKCGDDLPEPHFLSWNNIISTTPDFHLPEFFGQARFI